MIYIIIYIILFAISFGIVAAKHGEPKEGEYNIWVYSISSFIDLWLLYKAGLFNELISALL